ncbi:P protein [Pseudolycoriella hygida]|uniref:P protein n=1 Tax=Pseudolycoriella hygida TaxID=35572 RepID=A0A9Q0MI76_9DIPT|nr:P protein [Pseudolycoriella hygida]
MKALHEDHFKLHSATAIHFDEKTLTTRTQRVILTATKVKILVLTLIWLITTVIFIVKPIKYPTYYNSYIPPISGRTVRINKILDENRLEIHLKGAFSDIVTGSSLTLQVRTFVGNETKLLADTLKFSLVNEKDFETAKPTEVFASITIPEELRSVASDLEIFLSTNYGVMFTLSMAFELIPLSVGAGIGFGAAVLGLLYVLIVFEIVDRTFASLLVSSLSIAALALFNERPNLEEVVSWIDMDTLMLLFGMMILVAITSETGFFDYMAVFAFKRTKGKTWPLICCLSSFAMIAALFLDSVSTILLMTPVVIRICEVTNLNPVSVLTIIILSINVGSIASPVGNPPNVMIINNEFVKQSNIGFIEFLIHVLPGVVLLILQSFVQIRYVTFRKIESLQNEDPIEVSNIKHELEMWKNTDRSISAVSKFDEISRNVIHSRVLLLNEALQRELESCHRHKHSKERIQRNNPSCYFLNKKVVEIDPTDEDQNHEEIARRLEKMYPIKNKLLLRQCGTAFAVVICFFFLHSVPYFENISLGWASLLGVCLLLIISNNSDDVKTCLLMVEWSSLLFFATLFVLMESLTKIGLIRVIGEKLADIVKHFSPDNRLAMAVLVVLWVSAFISAFLDNIPLTSMMIKVIVTLSSTLKLPAGPMIWALAFGCGVGGKLLINYVTKDV